jgi:hypothetical protein
MAGQKVSWLEMDLEGREYTARQRAELEHSLLAAQKRLTRLELEESERQTFESLMAAVVQCFLVDDIWTADSLAQELGVDSNLDMLNRVLVQLKFRHEFIAYMSQENDIFGLHLEKDGEVYRGQDSIERHRILLDMHRNSKGEVPTWMQGNAASNARTDEADVATR